MKNYHIVIKADWNDADYVHNCFDTDEQEKDHVVKTYLLSQRFIKEYSKRYPTRWRNQAHLEDVHAFADRLLKFDEETDSYIFNEELIEEEKWVSDLFTVEEISDFVYFYEDYIPHGFDFPSHTLHELEVYEFIKKETYDKTTIS